MKGLRVSVRAALLAWLTWTAGCAAGEEEPRTIDAPVEAQPDGAPHFADVFAIMEQSCGGGMSGCHITGMAAGLAMPDLDAAHASLVGVASAKCEGSQRVVPGDADASLLVQVLEGSSSCVKAMPLGRAALGQDEIDVVREWIDSGASVD